MEWRPVLHGDDAARARALIASIVATLDALPLTDPSLANGTAGIALLHGQRARAGDPDAADQAFAYLERMLANIDELRTPWLFRGYAGIGYAMHQLVDIVGEQDEPLAAIDGLITHALAADPWPPAIWELQEGAIGLGVYGLVRGARVMVDRVVEILATCAEITDDGVTWRAIEDGQPHFNLGIAHGVAGAIGFLAEVVRLADPPPRAHELLRGAVRWLRAREQAETTPAYPMVIGLPHPSSFRVDGWCYGDPSTAVILIRAGEALADQEVIDAGVALARRAARRTEAQLASLMLTRTLCHGAIGHALIFHVLANVLDDDELRATARAWYLRTLDDPTAITATGIQDGLAGVALGLVAGTAQAAPTWARMLMLA